MPAVKINKSKYYCRYYLPIIQIHHGNIIVDNQYNYVLWPVATCYICFQNDSQKLNIKKLQFISRCVLKIITLHIIYTNSYRS